MRRILTLYDLSRSELIQLIKRAVEVFSDGKNIRPRRRLDGKVVLLYFEKPSTRTRISFETAVVKLGGTPIYTNPSETQISRGEDKSDFMKVVAGYIDIMVARVYDHNTLEVFSRSADIPIINGLSDLSHPTQIISDIATIEFLLGDHRNKKICFFGDAKNNVARSWIEAHNVLGDFDLSFSCPEGFEPTEPGNYTIEREPAKAIKNADVVYLDVWFSMGQDFDEEKYKLLEPYSMNDHRMEMLSDKLVLHCLPAKKGEEISHNVFSAHQKSIFVQAHMKLAGAVSIFESIDL